MDRMTTDVAVSYDQFRRHAQRFLAVVDRAEILPTRSFLLELGAALADLYALALMLPDTPSATDTTLDAEVQSPSLESVAAAIAARDDEGPVQARLTEDVAAIYRALKEGIMRMSQGGSPQEILGHWRQTFLTQWGDHATAAMRAIYLVLRTDLFPAPTR